MERIFVESQVPVLADPGMSLALDGAWTVQRWPFAVPEADLAAASLNDSHWQTVAQPGQVFYADPDAEGAPIPNWNRVTLTHIDPDDGAMLRRRVVVPAAWHGRRIFLRDGAVDNPNSWEADMIRVTREEALARGWSGVYPGARI